MDTSYSFLATISGVFLLLLVLVSPGQCQYSQGCSRALEDVPDPSSDSCQAFFRCFNGNQYSLRCPLGQVFDFDRSRCRLTNSVNCELQLQRFQAPAVPGYMWPNQRSPHEGDVEIRVVHVGPDTGVGNAQTGQNPPSQDGRPRATQPQLPPQPALPNAGQGQTQGQGRNGGQTQGQVQGQFPTVQLQVPSRGRPQQNTIPNFLPGSPGK